MFRVGLTAVVSKGIIMAVLALEVIGRPGLSHFTQALIITIVGATITGSFTVLGAWIAVKRATEAVGPVHDDVRDVKKKLGAANREEDQTDG